MQEDNPPALLVFQNLQDKIPDTLMVILLLDQPYGLLDPIEGLLLAVDKDHVATSS